MLRVAFAGTSSFAVPTLSALAASSHELLGVLTRPDRPAGRGRHLTASPVKQRALELGYPVEQPESLRSEAERAALLSWRPDVLVVVAYGLILPAPVLGLPALGCLNVHASLLPRWRGAAPIQRAILAGDTHTGVSIMRMEAGLDTGPVLAQRRLAIGELTTATQLHDELAVLGAQLLIETLGRLEAGTLEERAQPSEGASYAPKLEKSEARIDWCESAMQIARRVHALNPWPGTETSAGGAPLRILEAAAVDQAAGSRPAAPPGVVLGLEGDALLVQCGTGVLAVRCVQRPGRRAIPAREFAHAQPLTGLRFA